MILATFAAVGAVLAGLFVIGSPASQRSRRLDRERSENLRTISFAVDEYRSRNPALPKSLSELAQASEMQLELEDPETRRPYEYRVVSPTSYELCAQFARQSDERENAWTHEEGRECFTLQPRPKGNSQRP